MEHLTSIILAGYGDVSGNQLIDKIKATPESYINDERSAIKELANLMID